jgi:tetratricopeptide (TPR) repeat protein
VIKGFFLTSDFRSALIAAVTIVVAGCAAVQPVETPSPIEIPPVEQSVTEVAQPEVSADSTAQDVEVVPDDSAAQPVDAVPTSSAASTEAIAQFKNLRMTEGMKILQVAVASGTAIAVDYYNLAVAQRASGSLLAAVDNAAQAVTLAPNSRTILRLYIEISRELGRKNEPAVLLESLYEKNKGRLNLGLALADAMMMAGRGMDALRLDTELLKKDESNTEIMVSMASAYLAMGRVDAARFILLQSIRVKEEADVYDILGKLEMNDGNNRRAIELFTKALELDPRLVGARNNLGLLYLNAGDVDGAVEQFSLAVELDPVCWQAFVNLGNAFRKNRQFGNGFEAFDKALKINPLCAECYFNMGVAEIENIPADGMDKADHYRRGAEFLKRYKTMVRIGGGTAETADKYIDEAVRMADFVEQQGALMRSAAEKAEKDKAEGVSSPEKADEDGADESPVDQPAEDKGGSPAKPPVPADDGWDFN